MGGLRIIKSGLLSTIQDGGRLGYQQYGVPVSGVMDFYAYRLANYLVGNAEEDAVIEVTMMGFAVEFLQDTVIAVTGGNSTPTVNGRAIGMWETVFVVSGDKLAFQRVKTGCRCYVAIAGGIAVPKVMGSRSTYLRGGFGGYEGRALRNGDVLEIGKRKNKLEMLRDRSFADQAMEYPSAITLRVVPGPQEEAFTNEGIGDFYSGFYKVTMDSDRMGFRLEGKKISHRNKSEIISDGIAMGAIQIPGQGQPILMMADRQTSGGYPKIGNVVTSDLPKLAQAKPGDTLRFQKITVEEAEEAFGRMEKELIQMKKTLNNGKNLLNPMEDKPDRKGDIKEEEPVYQKAESPKPKEDLSSREESTPERNELPLKPGQRKFIVRINEKEYTVLLERREKE